MAKVLQFVSQAPAVPTAESRYGLRPHRGVVSAKAAVPGDRIEQGTVISITRHRYRSKDDVSFICRCGSESTARRDHLADGHTQSCSCRRTTWAKTLYISMTDEERADLAENVYLYGRAKAAKMHNLPEFVIDLCRRWHIADLMDDPELVTSIRRIVHGTARFIDGVRRASKYLSLSIYATKAVLARTNHAVAATAKVQKFELSAEARLLVERAVEGLQSAGDPMFRELTVESAADHLLELMTAAANHVSDTVGESDHLSTREFPTPQTKAFAKSVRLLAWMWRVFAALDRESVRLLGDEIGWLIDCLKRNVAGRKQRQKDAIEKANRGLNVKSGGRPSDRFTWKQPALDHNAGAAVLKAGHCEMEVLLAAAA